MRVMPLLAITGDDAGDNDNDEDKEKTYFRKKAKKTADLIGRHHDLTRLIDRLKDREGRHVDAAVEMLRARRKALEKKAFTHCNFSSRCCYRKTIEYIWWFSNSHIKSCI